MQRKTPQRSAEQQRRLADLAIAHQDFPLYAKHGKALESIRCGLHNEVPHLNRLFSCGRSSHEGLGRLLRIQLDKRSRCSIGCQIELAKKLPVGRIHANGTGFVPPIRADLYSALQLAAEPSQQSSTTASAVAPSPASSPDAPAQGLPQDWDSIEVGHLVIAQENMIEGWWEAIVIATDNDMLTLKWRDYPKFPPLSRHRTAVALLKPTATDV
jgi:hypothetical protein